ncbi:ArsR/SmtB family transcription factor [Roseospira visakhapatnamensis]|uniref:ArsR family transcriptional regulator n=1 Tax=Roseospira visakhapatnamensis TaxID=390880 RepID=A0A7W6WAK0_9PROT|nr:helix-turn-helix domain-containing protein [Roseospira visakhapatnamensis]MBB4267260.1 ArsR family transcriptional regulator [Roseospira visakhapatnamensis]
MVDRLEQSKALASDVRLTILTWLKTPALHFPHQVTGDPAEIGVCVTLLADTLRISQPTVSRHLEVLRRAGFLRVRRIGRWSFFARDEITLSDYAEWLRDTL